MCYDKICKLVGSHLHDMRIILVILVQDNKCLHNLLSSSLYSWDFFEDPRHIFK